MSEPKRIYFDECFAFNDRASIDDKGKCFEDSIFTDYRESNEDIEYSLMPLQIGVYSLSLSDDGRSVYIKHNGGEGGSFDLLILKNILMNILGVDSNDR